MLVADRPNVWMIVVLVALAACASTGGEGVLPGSEPYTPDDAWDVLTAEELTEYRSLDAHAAIRRLKSFWLSTGGTGSWTPAPATDETRLEIKVYIDGVLQPTGVEELRRVEVPEIREIRRLCGREATLRFGSDHGAGAIMVMTGR